MTTLTMSPRHTDDNSNVDAETNKFANGKGKFHLYEIIYPKHITSRASRFMWFVYFLAARRIFDIAAVPAIACDHVREYSCTMRNKSGARVWLKALHFMFGMIFAMLCCYVWGSFYMRQASDISGSAVCCLLSAAHVFVCLPICANKWLCVRIVSELQRPK